MARKGSQKDGGPDHLSVARSLLDDLSTAAGALAVLKAQPRADLEVLIQAEQARFDDYRGRLFDLSIRARQVRVRCEVYGLVEWPSIDREALESTVDNGMGAESGPADFEVLATEVYEDDGVTTPLPDLSDEGLPGPDLTDPQVFERETGLGDGPDTLVPESSGDLEESVDLDASLEAEMVDDLAEDSEYLDDEESSSDDETAPEKATLVGEESVGEEDDPLDFLEGEPEPEPDAAKDTEPELAEDTAAEDDDVLEVEDDTLEQAAAPPIQVDPIAAAEESFDPVEAALFEVDVGAGDDAGVHSGNDNPANLVDELGQAILPTIKDRSGGGTTGPIAAAAIQLNADGSATAIGAGDDDEDIELELGDAGPEYDAMPIADEGFSFDHEEPEYEDDEESVDLPKAPQLTADEPGYSNYHDGSAELSGDDISQIEEVDDAKIRRLEEQAQEALERGDLHAAATSYSDLLELDPTNLDAYLGRGRCYLDLGDYAAAMSDFQKGEDLDPEGPESLVAMGELFFARKEYSRAIEFFDQAIELDGSHAMARCRRGISYYYKKSYRQAFLDLQKAYTLDPEIPNIRKYVQMAIKKLERSGEG